MDTTAIDAKIRESIGGHRRAWVRPAIGIAAALVLAVLGWRGLRQPAPDMVCTTAATDHHREVIEGRQHNWLTDPAAIEALAAREGLDASTLTRLVPADVKLSRGKRCRILGTPYVHLVYAQGSNEFSVFLRAEAGDANGVYTGTAGPDRVAWFHSARVRGVVVETGDGASAARIARSAAAVL